MNEKGDKPFRSDGGRVGPRRPARSGGDDGSYFCCSCARLVGTAYQILPYMNARVCLDCINKNKCFPIPAIEISNKAYAPWSEQSVANIKEYQSSNLFLPFVCDSGHVLIPEQSGLVCKSCHHFQLTWTYPWVLDGSWKDEL
ncbi:MAG TPA: hypothetical protein V6C89_04180 [Drouetiella sp.]